MNSAKNLACVLLFSAVSAFCSGQRAYAQSVDELLDGLTGYASSLTDKSFEVEFSHSDTYFRPAGKKYFYKELEVKQKIAKQKYHIKYREYFPTKPEGKQRSGSEIMYKDGISTEQMGDAVTISPHFVVRLVGYNRFTDYLSIGIFDGVKWGANEILERNDGVEPGDLTDTYLLPHRVIQNRAKYRNGGLETVDGFSCVILEWPKNDRIWLDTEHGFIPRKRQLFLNGELITENVQKDVRSVGKTWIPWVQEVKNYYSSKENSKHAGNVYTYSINRINAFEFREFADIEFEFKFNPKEKVLIKDEVQNKTYFKHPEKNR